MINKAILVGNVGSEPDVRFLDKDVPVARFSLATSERASPNLFLPYLATTKERQRHAPIRRTE